MFLLLFPLLFLVRGELLACVKGNANRILSRSFRNPIPVLWELGRTKPLLLHVMSLPLRVFAMIIVPAPIPVPSTTCVVSVMIQVKTSITRDHASRREVPRVSQSRPIAFVLSLTMDDL